MEIGIIGLGKMGYNLALNLVKNHHRVVAYDVNNKALGDIAHEDVIPAYTIKDLIGKLSGRKIVWLMVPSGEATEKVIAEVAIYLNPQDIIIDGGNSNYKDSIRRYNNLKEKQIDFLDCGTSGGTSGALDGACTMVGGNKKVFDYCEQIFKDISVEDGYLYTGEAGSGHFVKMVHNGVEYGMMQSIAEGFEVLNKCNYDIDYEKIAKVWNHGSVIRGWLMELMEDAFSHDKNLGSIRGLMNSSGEGKWTVQEALDLGVPAPVITLSLFMRYRSQEDDTFTGKVVAALRNEFGGHAVEKNK